MSTAVATINVDTVPNVLEELQEAFYDIPFENSDYQNRAFVVAAQQTPARAYRAVGLRMFSKIQAVKEYMYNQEKTKIDIEEKEWLIGQPTTNDFERRRLQLEIAKIKDGQAWGEKLLNDAIRELNCLYAEFKRLPKYTRETFEAEEIQHFTVRLQRQLQAGGAMESVLNMTEDLPQMEQRIQKAIAYMGQPQEKKPLVSAPLKVGNTPIV